MSHCLNCAGRTYTYPDKYRGCICRKQIMEDCKVRSTNFPKRTGNPLTPHLTNLILILIIIIIN